MPAGRPAGRQACQLLMPLEQTRTVAVITGEGWLMKGSADYTQSGGREGSQGRVGERSMAKQVGSGTVALPPAIGPVCLRC